MGADRRLATLRAICDTFAPGGDGLPVASAIGTHPLGDKLWPHHISERTAYQEAMCIGGTVRDIRDAAVAVAEINELTKTVIKLIK